MSVAIDGQEKRIGLALSGGGFRAAAFHLGVFCKLAELGLLKKIDVFSCVSGGSIAGAFLTLNWDRADALDRLQAYLQRSSIAAISVLAGAFDLFTSRIERLARRYDHDLFHNKTLSDLAGGPRIYFNATNLSSGNLFFFVGGGGGPAEMGDHELGVRDAASFPVAKAVAASSSFPPVFNPLQLSISEFPASQGVEYTTLTDGGVYDNLGINPLLLERNKLDYLIVSDAGKPFEIDKKPPRSGTIALKQSVGILMEQVRGLQFDRILFRHSAHRGPKPVWFSIDSTEGEAQSGDAKSASSIGTNLKKLSTEQAETLMRHGGALFETRIRRHAGELLRQ